VVIENYKNGYVDSTTASHEEKARDALPLKSGTLSVALPGDNVCLDCMALESQHFPLSPSLPILNLINNHTLLLFLQHVLPLPSRDPLVLLFVDCRSMKLCSDFVIMYEDPRIGFEKAIDILP
jgi:hypothetical protein